MTPGPLRFDRFVEAALYGPAGFFTGAGGAGRRADFLTSPEVGPLFGAVLARALDSEWERLGRPPRFVVIEAGAGRGALARAVLDAGPACRAALHYVCVERSGALRERAEADLDPEVAIVAHLPATREPGVVVANELLDNLAFRLLERPADGWAEVAVDREGDVPAEVLVEAPSDAAAQAEGLAPHSAVGARLPLQHEAATWLSRALAAVERGRVVVIDTCSTTPSMAARPWREWVRTYRGHRRGGHPVDEPGAQDITCEVAVDQLAQIRPPDADHSQADWLTHHGIDELVEDARTTWRARAATGDLIALAARSRVGEAEALRDPSGLGAFRVLEWTVGECRTPG